MSVWAEKRDSRKLNAVLSSSVVLWLIVAIMWRATGTAEHVVLLVLLGASFVNLVPFVFAVHGASFRQIADRRQNGRWPTNLEAVFRDGNTMKQVLPGVIEFREETLVFTPRDGDGTHHVTWDPSWQLVGRRSRGWRIRYDLRAYNSRTAKTMYMWTTGGSAIRLE